jgi:flagellar basal body-associated protein FliL
LGQIRGPTSDEQRTPFAASVVIGYDPQQSELADELQKRRSQISNAILTWIAKRTYREFLADQPDHIQEALVDVVNGPMSAGRVREVLLDGLTIVR